MHRRPKQKASPAERLEAIFQRLVDAVFRRWPRKSPPPLLLPSCRLISHRGEHDNRNRFENTLAAFDAAAAAGVWGIELDVRWTADLVPVVFHDPDTRRLFQTDAVVSRVTLDSLRRHLPLIPTLAEVIGRYAGRMHLMIEIKSEPYPRPSVQTRRMRSHLRDLAPGKDFHLMALHPQMFGFFDFLPASTMIPIGRARIDRFSRLAATHRWGGVAGHYLLTTAQVLKRHHRLGQGVGTVFVDSRRCLFREVNRGVDWIFTNRAAHLQAVCN